MKQITKIIVKHNQIKYIYSNEVIHKRTEYTIKFDGYYKGCVDYYVSKSKINQVIYGQLDCVLYVSTEKFKQDKRKWINKVVDAYEERFEHYKWYREPLFVEEE